MRRRTQKEKDYIKECTFKLNSFILDILHLQFMKDGTVKTNQGEILTLNGKVCKLFNQSGYKLDNETPFRPLTKSKMMFNLFDMYCRNMEMDEDRYITEVVFGPTISKNEKNYVIVKEEGYPDYKSKKYYTESLRLIDAMCGLNEIVPPIDLEEFDLVLANKTE